MRVRTVYHGNLANMKLFTTKSSDQYEKIKKLKEEIEMWKLHDTNLLNACMDLRFKIKENYEQLSSLKILDVEEIKTYKHVQSLNVSDRDNMCVWFGTEEEFQEEN